MIVMRLTFQAEQGEVGGCLTGFAVGLVKTTCISTQNTPSAVDGLARINVLRDPSKLSRR
jgi:hypothetical protein